MVKRRPLMTAALLLSLGKALPAFAELPSNKPLAQAEASATMPEIGMPMSIARELLFGQNMKEQLIGGACGMLEVLSSEDNSIRIIGVGGVVTSVSERKKPLGAIDDDGNKNENQSLELNKRK